MKQHEFGPMVFKIAALWLWLRAFLGIRGIFISLSSLYYTLAYGGGMRGAPTRGMMLNPILVNILPTLLLILGGWLLRRNADHFAARFFASPEDSAPEQPVTGVEARDLFVVAVTLMGLYLAADGIVALIRDLAMSFVILWPAFMGTSRGNPSGGGIMLVEFLGVMAGNGLQTAIGFGLFRGGFRMLRQWPAWPAPLPQESREDA